MAHASPAQGIALEVTDLHKSYGPNEVLHGVDLEVRHGEIHALLGANGAGKSTLLRIIMGATRRSSGSIRIDGEDVDFHTPVEARAAGIGMVFQERSVLPELTVAQNVFLNDEQTRLGIIDSGREEAETRQLFERLGVGINPRAKVGRLSVGDQQMVEIAKALRLAEQVLILDEPTAALTEREVGRLFEVLRQISSAGTAIIYVSHRLSEVFELCDRVTVLRDGVAHLDRPTAEVNMDAVVEAMAGGALKEIAPPSKPAARDGASTVLAVRDLTVRNKIHSASFEIRAGEIVGIAGLAGSGRSTLLKALFGDVPLVDGEIKLGGRRVAPRSPSRAIRAGIAMIPEDRKTAGLVLDHSVERNATASVLRRLRKRLLIDERESERMTWDMIHQLKIVTSGPDQRVGRLSGGNQQKVVLGKAFHAQGRVLLLDEPTFGVDVHAAADIIRRVRGFVDAGNAALWVTSDLLELPKVADRVLVLVDGVVTQIVDNYPERLTEADLTHLIQPRGEAAAR